MSIEKKEKKPGERYSFGRCVICGLVRALKSGVCQDCNEKMTDMVPSPLEDIFGWKGVGSGKGG